MVLDYSEIGRNIRMYRLARQLKQKDLANQINMTEQHISHIENAYTKVSLPTLVAIANVLAVDCNSLLRATLTKVQKELRMEEIVSLLACMDEKKLRLCVEICRLVADSDS